MSEVGSPYPDPASASAKQPTCNRRFFLNELKWINSLDFIMWLPLSDAFFFNPLKVLAEISKCPLGIYAGGGISDTVYDFYYMFHTVREMEF